MYIPKKVPENIGSPHLRRPTSQTHFGSIYIITVVPDNLSHDLVPYNGNIKLNIILKIFKKQQSLTITLII